MGGQTGLNTAIEVAKAGILKEFGVEMIGASIEAINKAEDRDLFRSAMDKIGLRIPKSGIATNIGVESTAREAFQYGYNQIFITDAMATFTKEEHEATLSYIFPKIGKLRTTQQFLTEN